MSTQASLAAAGDYLLRLTVSDGALTSFDEVAVTVIAAPTNTAPVVEAGADQTINEGASAALNGTASDDGLPGGQLSAAWPVASGPGAVTFGDPSSMSTQASFAAAGDYVLRLTVSDGALTFIKESQAQSNVDILSVGLFALRDESLRLMSG